MTIRNKATAIRLLDFHSVPMRAFHMTWLAFFLCFFGWFGIAPLMPIIRGELHLTKGADRQFGDCRGCDHDPGAPADGLALRPHRSAPRVHLAADIGIAAGHGRRTRARLHDVPGLPPRDRRHRRVVRDHAVPHVGDVRAEHRRNRQRDRRGLGQSGRRSHAVCDAAALQRVHELRSRKLVELATRDAGGRRGSAGHRSRLLLLTQDTPDGNFQKLRASCAMRPGLKASGAFVEACRDPRVWALALLYACVVRHRTDDRQFRGALLHRHFPSLPAMAGLVAGSSA